MKETWLVVSLLLLIDAPFAVTFCQSASRASGNSDSTDLDTEAQPDNPAKKASETTDPRIELGPADSPASKVDGTSIAQPPRALSSARSAVPAGKNAPKRNQHFVVAIDVGHSKGQGGAV